MKTNGNQDRLRHLAVAFHKLSQEMPELNVDPPAMRTLPAESKVRPMFRVRLRSSTGQARARMYVYDQGAKLETRVAGAGDGEAKRSVRDDLPIDLRRGYRLDTSMFEDAGQLAEVLCQHMTRELEAVAGEAS